MKHLRPIAKHDKKPEQIQDCYVFEILSSKHSLRIAKPVISKLHITLKGVQKEEIQESEIEAKKYLNVICCLM